MKRKRKTGQQQQVAPCTLDSQRPGSEVRSEKSHSMIEVETHDYAASRIQDYIDLTNECYALFAAKYGMHESVNYPFQHPDFETWDFEN